MITSLRIENFALIEAAEINFNSGFTVITGETGSGKSILLNALNLILGERANFSVIGATSDKSIVEADVDITGFGLEVFFESNELDYFDKTIVRREINKQGRSRAFINDVPVQLNVLKEFSSQLIHIHSQYNTLELKDVNFQLYVLDVLAGVLDEKEIFSKRFEELRKSKSLLSSKKEELSNSLAQADYNAFQLNELQELSLSTKNYDQLNQEVLKGQNADEIKSIYGEISAALETENGIVDQLVYLKNLSGKKVDVSPEIKAYYERINALVIEAKDLAQEIGDANESFSFDAIQMNEIVEQLDNYNRICQKHNVNTQEALVALMDELDGFNQNHDNLASEIDQLAARILHEEAELTKLSDQLHLKRKEAIPAIETKIKSALSELKLIDTALIFQLTKEETLSASGGSKLQLLFSPNVGIEPVPVHQAASGGELSRVMLALQSLMSSKIQLRSMLFDEIDTGVSGDVAQKMGVTLKKMGEEMQVIAITHLPQVAAKGGQHLKVVKRVVEGKTHTFVEELSLEQRIEETARLMSGDQINLAALENAKALMN